jgi:drug/metabolite transporter (DMT)-like permease
MSRRLLWYFWGSLAALAVGVVVIFGPADRLADPLVGFVLSLLPAAFFGLIAGLLAVVRAGARGERTFFGLAALFGVAAALATHALFSFPGDCFDACASPRVSGTTLLVVTLAAAVLTVAVPAILYTQGLFGRSDR